MFGLIKMNTFVQDCLEGKTIVDKIDDYIDMWHDGGSTIPLHTFLGLRKEDYISWINEEESLNLLLNKYKIDQE